MIEDTELLRRYATEASETAFAEFVRRHVDFVYGCAVRRVGGDGHFAEDVTQQVFVAAARQARVLARHPVPTGWLFTATKNISAQLVRTERRRHAREEEAASMPESNPRPGESHDLAWQNVKPFLDDALDRLSETDRQAVLLRYFAGKSYAEIGVRLRLAENTARMRVDRALDKLAAGLGRHGVTSSASALALALSVQPGIAAPAGLAVAATQAAVAQSATAGVVFMAMTKLQLAVASAVVLAGAAGFVWQAQESAALQPREAALAHDLALARQTVAREEARAEASRRAAEERLRAEEGQLAELKRQAADIRERVRVAEEQRSTAKPRARASTVAGKVYDMSALDVMPKPTKQLPPKYPESIRSLGLGGEAMLDFVVDENGAVQDGRVISATHVELGEAALAAARQWAFKPGQKQGKPVATKVRVPIVFKMADDQPREGADRKKDHAPWF